VEEIVSLYFLTFAQRKSKSTVKLKFGLSPDFSVQLKVSLSELLLKRLSQKLNWPTDKANKPYIAACVSQDKSLQAAKIFISWLVDG